MKRIVLVFSLISLVCSAENLRQPADATTSAAETGEPAVAAPSTTAHKKYPVGPLAKEDTYCSFGNLAVTREAHPSDTPNYFFRTFNRDGGEYVSYAGGNHTLNVLDLQTSKEYHFDGPYDPVPVGTDLISVPDNLKFYKLKEIMSGNRKPEELKVGHQPNLGGVYQSVGDMGTKDGATQYRIITDLKGGTIVDYVVKDSASDNPSVSAVRKPTRICPEVDFKLPMISKDGTMLAAYDSRAGVSKIWEIDPAGGKCKLKENLGIAVSKADFSFDNKQIVFHTTSAPDITEYFENPDGKVSMNVYVYDLENHTLKKMTQNPWGKNSYYPVWRPDGTIVYSQINDGQKPVFVQADPSKVHGGKFDPNQAHGRMGEELFAIGQMWSHACTGKETSASNAIATALSLDPARCRALVKDKWREYKSLAGTDYKKELNRPSAGIASLRAADLEKVCPTTSADTTAVDSQPIENLPTGLPKGQQVMSKKCSMCHSADFNSREQLAKKADNYSKGQDSISHPEDAAVSLYQEIQRRINLPEGQPERMPKKGKLTADEISAISDYMNTLLTQTP